MSGKSAQNTTIHIFSLRSTSLDTDELSYNKFLLYLLTSIYIPRLAPTWSKAHKLNKVSIYCLLFNDLPFLCKPNNITKNGLKACREKEGKNLSPDKRRKRCNLKRMRKTGLFLIFI